jgi:hypothetical protein
MATVRTTMPIPPSQWVRDLQNRTDRGRGSIAVRIEAPVVVNPLIVSKNASVYEGMAPERTKGTAPTAEAAIQLAVTIRKPSRVRRWCLVPSFGLESIHRKVQNVTVRTIVAPKASAETISPLKRAIPRGKNMNREISIRSRLTMCSTGVNRIMFR